MIRRVPLKRSYMKRSPPRRLDDETYEESAYKRWIHTLPCVVSGYEGERVHASHVGSGGMAQKKGSWFDAVPMESGVHSEWEEHRGRFAGWSRDHRKEMATDWIRATRTMALLAGFMGPPIGQ